MHGKKLIFQGEKIAVSIHFLDISQKGTCPREGCPRAAPMFPLPDRAQRGPPTPETVKSEAAGNPPPGKRRFPRAGGRGGIIPRRCSSIPHRSPGRGAAQGRPFRRCPAPACCGRASGNTEVSTPTRAPHLRLSRSSGLGGLRTPLANTPPQAKRVLKPAEPATGPGQWGKLTAATTGLSEQLAGLWPRSPGGEATKRTSQRRGAGAIARAKGLRTGRRPWGGTRPGRLARAGYRWRFASASRSPRRGLCARDPRSVSRSESREGRASPRLQAPRKEAGCARGEGARKRRARRQPPGVCTGSPHRPAAPPLRLPEQSAPGRGAPAISGAVRRGGEGSRWVCCE